MSGIAKMEDFMPSKSMIEVDGRSDERKLLLYFPKEFYGKKVEVFPDMNAMKMMVSILPRNYEGGVKIQKTLRYGKEVAYCSMGRKWFGGNIFYVKSAPYLYDGKKFIVDIEPYIIKIKPTPQGNMSPAVSVPVPIEDVIQPVENDPKKIAIACIRQLNKFAAECGYRFEVMDGKLSMSTGERLE